MDLQAQRLKEIIETYAIEINQKELMKVVEEIVPVAKEYMSFISTDYTNDDIGKLMFRLTNKANDYNKKILSGMTLGIIMGVSKFTDNTAGRLTGSFIEMVFGSADSEERTSAILIIRDTYIFAKNGFK